MSKMFTPVTTIIESRRKLESIMWQTVATCEEWNAIGPLSTLAESLISRMFRFPPQMLK